MAKIVKMKIVRRVEKYLHSFGTKAVFKYGGML